MEKLRRFRDKLREETGFSSVLEVYGTGELMLTGCKGLLDFSDRLILCETVSGILKIYGKGLSVCAYRADLLLVCGSIDAISFGEEGYAF